MARILRIVDADGGDRDARRHLRDREKRVEAVQHAEARLQRHADHRQVGVRRDGARQGGGEAGAADQHADAALAHRTPDSVAEYARTARERGIRVLICGAGLAAALPGAVAAHTDLPVIGVPLKSSLSVLDGLDALLAIAQMPPGVPVATVGVDNAKNAGHLAARILGA